MIIAWAVSTNKAVPFSISKVFGDNMVLQQGVEAVVFGFGTAGIKVTTSFNGAKLSTVVGSDNIWRQRLPIMVPSHTPHNISFSTTTDEVLTISNVLFGDVYICGGQSNMQVGIGNQLKPNQDLETSLADKYPSIRLFTVGERMPQWHSDGFPASLNWSPTPLNDLVDVEQPWSVASSETVNSGKWNYYFSAVCWIFGRQLFDSLGGTTPIGLISNNFGSTSIAQWMDTPAFQRCGLSDGSGLDSPAGRLFNAMIHPYIIGPMAVSGFTWYQGESDTGGPNGELYSCLFPSMIQSWRQLFAVPRAFFGFIQLAPFCMSDLTALPQMRDRQMAALSLPNVGYATSADHGEGCAIHPRNKEYCARRLANAALAIQYKRNTPWKSPSYKSSRHIGAGQVEVSLHDVTAGGLRIQYPFNQGYVDPNSPQCSWAALKYEDNTWVNATVSISDDRMKMILTAAAPPPTNKKVIACQYGYSPIPMLSAYLADADLPVLPFAPQVVSPSPSP